MRVSIHSIRPDEVELLAELPTGTTILRAVVVPGEDGWFVVDCLQIPGCMSQGRTLRQAAKNIREAAEMCLAVRKKLGMPLTIELSNSARVRRNAVRRPRESEVISSGREPRRERRQVRGASKLDCPTCAEARRTGKAYSMAAELEEYEEWLLAHDPGQVWSSEESKSVDDEPIAKEKPIPRRGRRIGQAK